MHRAKAIFLDLDGTLLSGDKTIPAENTAAIQEAAQLGTQIVLCSGRPPVTMQNIIRELGLDTLGGTAICFNGAALYDCGKGRMLQASRLDPDLVRAVFSEADALGIHTQVYDAGGLVTRSMDRETKFYMKTTGIPDRLLPSLPDGLTEMPCKMLCISLDDPDRLETLKQRLLASYGARINVFYSSESFLEIVRTGVDKGSGIQQLCRLLQISPEDTIGVGDSENDLSMLHTVGFACCMANGTGECKAAADYITERDCNHGGVAEVIRRFILEVS